MCSQTAAVQRPLQKHNCFARLGGAAWYGSHHHHHYTLLLRVADPYRSHGHDSRTRYSTASGQLRRFAQQRLIYLQHFVTIPYTRFANTGRPADCLAIEDVLTHFLKNRMFCHIAQVLAPLIFTQDGLFRLLLNPYKTNRVRSTTRGIFLQHRRCCTRLSRLPGMPSIPVP